jgi:hypothetical protein
MTRQNPKKARRGYADIIGKELDRHLDSVRYWLNGDVGSANMLAAMEFFNAVFPDQYDVNEGLVLYRGQGTDITDGSPRSYSYDESIATSFGCEPGAGLWAHITSSHEMAYLIERKVCHRCADSEAFSLSLDLAKVLEDYALGQHKWSIQKEVVILNTPPRGRTAHLYEIKCAREVA